MLDDVDEPVGRTYRFLRETRMTAVVCELVGRDEADARSMLTARLPDDDPGAGRGFSPRASKNRPTDP